MNDEILEAEQFADPVDRASAEAERSLAEALARQKVKSEPALPYIGCCYNCSAMLTPGNRFCDKDCQEDYDHRQSRRKVNGG